jgi:WD40 repeat protein
MIDVSGGAIEIESIRRIETNLAIAAVECIDDSVIFVSTEEAVLVFCSSGEELTYKVHSGAILCSTADNKRLLTGGDDGQIVCLYNDGTTGRLMVDERGRWIDSIASGWNGSFAWSIGRQVFWRTADGIEATLQVPSSVGGLDFARDRCALAIAHYNGVTIWQPEVEASPIVLSSKGSHLQPSFSPDGSVLVATMREPTLHAWSLADHTNELPMPGYPARVRSIDWTSDGCFLATSGSDRLTLLSFRASDNPLARMPLLLAPYSSLVVAVACNPANNMVAVGYADGLVLLVRLPDGAEILLKAPDGNSIAAMRWSRSGARLGMASENGQCRLVVIK